MNTNKLKFPHSQTTESSIPVLKKEIFVCLWLLMTTCFAKTESISDKTVVNLALILELNQIKVYQEILGKQDQPQTLIGSMIIEGSLIQDFLKLKDLVSKATNVILLKAKLEMESQLKMDCYQDYLIRLLAEKLNTTLFMVGKLSSCSNDFSFKNPAQFGDSRSMSHVIFLVSVTTEYYRLMLRDLVYSDQHVWNEALIIYDQSQVFSTFRNVMETTEKVFHFRHWTSDRATNARIIKNFRHVRTFIVDMNDKNVHSFFLLAAGLQLLNAMTTTVIIMDRDNLIESIRDFAFMAANITVIRPTLYDSKLFKTISNKINYQKIDFPQKIVKVLLQHLYLVMNNQKRNKTLGKRSGFISPFSWFDEFNVSLANDVKVFTDPNLNYCFDFNFESIYLGESHLERISYWSKKAGFKPILNRAETMRDRLLTQIHNKTFRVTTLEDPPFVMYREFDEHGAPLKGNDRFIGMAMDLLRALSEMKRFNYVIHRVKDETYGSLNETTGKWNGMIGELINNEADLAVASLTITYDRERVIDFTTPWMSLGLSIVIKKSISSTKLLQFMAPLSTNVWLMMLGAYIVVSITLFLVGRMTPYEWYVKHPCFNKVENQFSVLNSFWFTVGSLMQQGCDISPKATSTRMIGTIWWFFILIMISSYTANLAAFLTIERLQNDITSVEELSMQIKMKYGTIYGGSTYSFFKNSNISTYKKMWNFMKSDHSLFVDNTAKGIQKVLDGNYAFILESTLNEYYCQRNCNLMPLGGLLDSRGYAIGLPSGNNVLRDLLSESILRLQKEQVLESFRRLWLLRYNLTKSCFEHSNHAPTIRNQLGLEKMGGAFFGLIIGLTVSCIVSCIEMTIWASKRSMKKKKRSVYDVIDSQIKMAFGQCHRFKPNSPSTNSSSIHDSPVLCNTFKAGSATITIPSMRRYLKSASHEELYQPLPLERALLMKCDYNKPNKYSCFYEPYQAANGVIAQDAHKVTSL